MATFRHYRATVGTVALFLSGCASLPEPDPARGDCQLRAGASVLEGAAAPWGQGQAYGGAVTMIGACPEQLRIITRSANGSIVCHGDAAWCDAALASQPVQVTPAQLRELLGEPQP